MKTLRSLPAGVPELVATATFFLFVLMLDELSILPGALRWGTGLAVAVILFGAISGAHVNPGVSTGQLIGGKFPIGALPVYWFAQLAGGMLAFLIGWFLVGDGSIRAYAQKYVIEAGPGVGMWRAFRVEAFWVGVLAFVVRLTTNPRFPYKQFAPLFIGGTLALAVAVSGAETGGSFNPVRALAPLLLGGMGNGWGDWKYTLVAYVAGPLTGGVVAILVYGMVVLFRRPSE